MSSDSLPPQGRRRFCRIKNATAVVSRSKLYEMAAQHPGLFLKLDDITVVDLDKLDEIMAELPAAEISPPRKREVA